MSEYSANKSEKDILLKAMMESKSTKFFWKDKNRRFLGANQCFLDAYGFKDVSEIIGKNDEDMHWHENAEPFKTAEEEVLKYGKSVTNQLGKCIINGVSYAIMATKEPLYQDGEIVGLWGTFSILEDMTNSVLNSLPCAVGVYERDKDGNLTCTYISDLARDLVSSKADRYVEENEIMNLIYSEDLPWVQKLIIDTVRKNEGIDTTYRVKTLDGAIRYIRHTSRAVPEKDGSCRFFTIFRDVTDFKLREEKQKANISERYGDYLKKDFRANGLEDVLSVVDFQNTMLQSISNIYIAMYIINIKTHAFMKIYCQDYVEKVLEPFDDAQEALDKVCDVMVSAESQQETRAFVDLSTLANRLRGKKMLKLDFAGAITGWCRGQMIPVSYDENGAVKEVIYAVQFVQKEKMREQRLIEKAEMDAFTGLYNRSAGEKLIEEYLSSGKAGMFCLLDADDFKHYNDAYGHAVGDEILLAISHCMRDTFGKEDILVRLGGDEFVIFAPNICNQADAQELIGTFKKNVSKLEFDTFEENVSVSIGFVVCKEKQYTSFDDIYKIADAIMYKNKGKRKESQLKQQMESLINSIPGGVYKYDFGNHAHMVCCNQGFTDITGYTLEMIKGEFDGDYSRLCYGKDDVAIYNKAIHNLKMGATIQECSYCIRHCDGHMIQIKEKLSVYQNEDGNLEAMAVILDVGDINK